MAHCVLQRKPEIDVSLGWGLSSNSAKGIITIIQNKHKETKMRLAGKTALITGGNSGIGLATARLFVAEGARVAITGRNRKTLDAAIKELGNGALAMQADVTKVEEIERAVAAAVQKFGKLDIVFANAGIPGATPVGDTSLAAFEEIIRTNLTAVFFTVQASAAHLNSGASIILNGSVHAVLGVPGYSRRNQDADLVARSTNGPSHVGAGTKVGGNYGARSYGRSGGDRESRSVLGVGRSLVRHRHGDRGRWWGDGSATGRADLSKQFSGSGDL